MTILALDIETVQHPDVPRSEKDIEQDACSAAPHHRIVAAAGLVLRPSRLGEQDESGPWYDATDAMVFGGEVEPDERRIVAHLAKALAKSPKLLTYNGDGFDLRVIVAAMMEHGIQCPYLFSRDVTYRYSTDGHEDVQDVLSQHGAARRAKQDAWARRIGLPGKMGVDGSDVSRLVAERRLNELRSYNGQDTAQLAGVWLRKELVRGVLTLDGYRRSAASLVALCERTLGLRPIVEHERFDRKKFLMEA